MCASLSGLRAFTKAVIDSEPWRKDPLALRKRWDEEGYALREHGGGAGEQGRMCFAFMWDDGIVKPMPPVWRAMEMTKRALVAAGHKGPNNALCFRLLLKLIPCFSDRLGEPQTHGNIRQRRTSHFWFFSLYSKTPKT